MRPIVEGETEGLGSESHPFGLLAREQREAGLVDSAPVGLRQRANDALAHEPCPLENSLRWDVAHLDIGRYPLETKREGVLRERSGDFRCGSATASTRKEPITDLDDTALRSRSWRVPPPRRSPVSTSATTSRTSVGESGSRSATSSRPKGEMLSTSSNSPSAKAAVSPSRSLRYRQAQDEIVESQTFLREGNPQRPLVESLPTALTRRAHRSHLAADREAAAVSASVAR